MSRRRLLRAVALFSLAPLLAACENSATAFSMESSDHALTLVREQPYFWSDTVNQFIVVARLPACQRKIAIHPGAVAFANMEVFEAGDRLWALQQDGQWYLAGTENCLVQDWDPPTDGPPGPRVGTFRLREGAPVFIENTD